MNAGHFALMMFDKGMRKMIIIILMSMAIILALPVVAVFSMGSEAVTFLAETPNVEAAETIGFYMGGPIEGDTYAWGNCTYWAFAMRLWAGSPIPTTWGNANTWDDRARRDGYTVDRIPRGGAVFQSDEGQYGHVAYVVAVDPANGAWTISEMNAPRFNVVSQRTFNASAASSYTFIHVKKGAAQWTPSNLSLPSPISGT